MPTFDMTMLLAPELLGRWVGWRLRVVMAVALAGCLIIFAFLRWLPAVSWAFWPLAVLALLLALVGAVVVMAKPIAVNGLYLLITLFQAGKLLLAAATLSPGWQQIVNLGPLAGTRINLLPAALDVLSAAAVVHALSLHPCVCARPDAWPVRPGCWQRWRCSSSRRAWRRKFGNHGGHRPWRCSLAAWA